MTRDDAIHDCQGALDTFFTELTEPEPEPRTAPAADRLLDDAAIVARVRRMQAGRALHDDGWTDRYPSGSEADLALLDCYVAAGCTDPSQLDALYRSSALGQERREKWDRRDYKERTIRKALNGRVRPREDIPPRSASAGAPPPGEEPSPSGRRHEEAISDAPRLVVRSLADVTPQAVDWLWPRWLARGKLHLFAGHPGDGKSTLAAWIAALGSVGGAWPDGSPASQFRTLFVLGEDSLADTLRPRLDLFGADATQIGAVETVLDANGRERFFDVAKHLELLEDVVVAHDIDLLVIDPLSTALVGTDRNAEGDMRDRLTPLVKLAERKNLAVLGIGHVGKPTGTNRTPLQRILGSTGLGALARLVWMTAPAEARMAMGPVKSNLAIVPDALLWTREEDGPVVWHGSAGKKLEALLDSALPRTSRADAEGFLRDCLQDGPQLSQEVVEAAKQHGISYSTLRRASETIRLTKRKDPGLNGPWRWSLPESDSTTAATENEQDEGNLLNPRDSDMSKLSKFPCWNLLNGDGGEHLHATTPVFDNDRQPSTFDVLEVAQLAHPPSLGSEQVPPRNDDAGAFDVPTGCGAPPACATLGPCHLYQRDGRCWGETAQ